MKAEQEPEVIKRDDAVRAAESVLPGGYAFDAVEAIAAVPAVKAAGGTDDLVRVVRCRKCLFLDVCIIKQMTVMGDDGFCALGKKEGDAGESN